MKRTPAYNNGLPKAALNGFDLTFVQRLHQYFY